MAFGPELNHQLHLHPKAVYCTGWLTLIVTLHLYVIRFRDSAFHRC